jgi:hypothetical protein
MIDIHVQSDGDPQVLADLIASTLHGHIGPVAETSLAAVGKLVREHQEQAEAARPTRAQLETVDFQRIDDETDWTDV